MKLKEIIDNWGWEKFQESNSNNLPPQLELSKSEYNQRKNHEISLYALNGVYVITIDDKSIVDLSGVETQRGYFSHGAHMPQDKEIKIDSIDFLEGFKKLYHLKNRFIHIRSEKMDFLGIGKRMEDAGLLYSK